MRTSYTDAGVAVDGCSTLIDSALGMSGKLLQAVRYPGGSTNGGRSAPRGGRNLVQNACSGSPK
jgi:hypothetical protein